MKIIFALKFLKYIDTMYIYTNTIFYEVFLELLWSRNIIFV